LDIRRVRLDMGWVRLEMWADVRLDVWFYHLVRQQPGEPITAETWQNRLEEELTAETWQNRLEEELTAETWQNRLEEELTAAM